MAKNWINPLSFAAVLVAVYATDVYYVRAGAAVRRTLQEHIQEVGHNVRDYGARGDDLSDDTSAFRAAVTAAGIGGLILIPPGNYRVDGIRLLNRQHLVGLGGTGGSGNGRPHNVPAGDDVTGVVLTRYSGNPTGIAAAAGAQRLNVSNIDLKGYAVALDLRGVNYSLFSDMAFTGNGRDIYLGSPGSIGNTLQHMRSTGATVRSIDCDTTSTPNHVNGNRFLGLTLECPEQSILNGAGGNGAASNTFVGCEFQGNGIWCRNVSGLEFSGCYFEGGVPIDLDDACTGVAIHGSYFQNFTAAAIRIGYRNAAFNGTCYGAAITGNVFYNERPNGIGIDFRTSSAADVTVDANTHDNGGHTSYVPLRDPSGVAATKTRMLNTTLLPAAGPINDGKLVIERTGGGSTNLIIYAGGQRYRIQGGFPF